MTGPSNHFNMIDILQHPVHTLLRERLRIHSVFIRSSWSPAIFSISHHLQNPCTQPLTTLSNLTSCPHYSFPHPQPQPTASSAHQIAPSASPTTKPGAESKNAGRNPSPQASTLSLQLTSLPVPLLATDTLPLRSLPPHPLPPLRPPPPAPKRPLDAKLLQLHHHLPPPQRLTAGRRLHGVSNDRERMSA